MDYRAKIEKVRFSYQPQLQISENLNNNMKTPYIKRTYRVSKEHAKAVKKSAKVTKTSESSVVRTLLESLLDK